MIATLSSFLALYTAAFSLLMGMGMLGTVLSLRMTVAGYSAAATGLVQAGYYLGLVIGSFACHRLVRRVGHIRTFAALAAVTTATVMLHGIYFSALVWGLLRLLTGVASIGLFMVIESWLNECTEPRDRGRVFSIYMVLSYLGIGIGQLLLNMGASGGQTHFFVAGMLLALCLVPVSLTSAISPALPRDTRFDLLALLRRSPLGVLGCLAAGMINSAFYSMGPVFGHAVGLTVPQLSLFMSVAVFGGLALQWPAGLISDRFDRTRALPLLAALIALASGAVLATATLSMTSLLAAVALFGGVSFTLYPVAVARSHDLFEPDQVVAVSSGLLLSYGIGASAGPVAASALMSIVGSPYALFAYTAAVSGLYAVTAVYLRRREAIEIVAVKDQAQFVMMKRTSQVAMVIDPRAEAPANTPE